MSFLFSSLNLNSERILHIIYYGISFPFDQNKINEGREKKESKLIKLGLQKVTLGKD